MYYKCTPSIPTTTSTRLFPLSLQLSFFSSPLHALLHEFSHVLILAATQSAAYHRAQFSPQTHRAAAALSNPQFLPQQRLLVVVAARWPAPRLQRRIRETERRESRVSTANRVPESPRIGVAGPKPARAAPQPKRQALRPRIGAAARRSGAR